MEHAAQCLFTRIFRAREERALRPACAEACQLKTAKPHHAGGQSNASHVGRGTAALRVALGCCGSARIENAGTRIFDSGTTTDRQTARCHVVGTTVAILR